MDLSVGFNASIVTGLICDRLIALNPTKDKNTYLEDLLKSQLCLTSPCKEVFIQLLQTEIVLITYEISTSIKPIILPDK